MDANKVVLTSAIVTVTSTGAASILPPNLGGRGEFPAFQLLVGTSFTFLGLSILADFAPQFAGPISAAIAVTALTYYGLPVLERYQGIGQPHKGKGKK